MTLILQLHVMFLVTIIYVPNARFGSLGLPADGEEDLADFAETFQVVGVNRFDFSIPDPTQAPVDAPEPTLAPPSHAVTLTPKNYNGCMKVNGNGEDDDEFMLASCDALDPLQQFIFDGYQVKLALDKSKCIQAGRVNAQPSHGIFMRVFPCETSKVQQQFTWDGPNGALTLVQFPTLAIVFQGVEANVNEDRIIIGDLTKGGVAARKDWVILN